MTLGSPWHVARQPHPPRYISSLNVRLMPVQYQPTIQFRMTNAVPNVTNAKSEIISQSRFESPFIAAPNARGSLCQSTASKRQYVATSSLSGPRMTILIASSGSGRCSALENAAKFKEQRVVTVG